jgi:hypothetical protein
MKRILIISILIICRCNCLLAQGEKDVIAICEGGDNDVLPFKKEQYYFAVSSKITVYSRPDARSKVFCQTSGYSDSIRVLEVLNNFPNYSPSKFKNIYGYWCKVAFPLNGKRFVGYIPSQFLARVHIRDGERIYLVNLESFNNDSFVCSLKILKNYQLIYEQKFSPVANYHNPKFERDTVGKEYSGYFGAMLCNNKGLQGVERVLLVYSGYPACLYWNGDNIFFIKEDKVVYYLEDGHIENAGDYYNKISFAFPSDSLGAKDAIIKTEEEYEVISDIKDLYWKSTVKYFWDGCKPEKSDSNYMIKLGKPYQEEIVDVDSE